MKYDNNSNFTDFNSFIKQRFNKNYLFYDYELDEVFNKLDSIFNIVKKVKKRFHRSSTCRLSPSLVQYVDLTSRVNEVPQDLFNFMMFDVRICIVKFKGSFYIYCDNFTPSENLRNYRAFDNFYYKCDFLDSNIKNMFAEFVADYCISFLGRLI